jgi:DNA gyrase inhibitor GyrI
MRVDITELEDVPIIYAAQAGTVDDVPAAAHQAWAALETRVPPRGRKLFGYWDPGAGEYRACYALRDGDEPEAQGLRRGVLPGGRYRRTRLKGSDVFRRIGLAFEQLAEAASIDETRPWFEFYRRHDEIDLLVPIKRERLDRKLDAADVKAE